MHSVMHNYKIMEQVIKIALDVSHFLQGQLSNNHRTGIYQVSKNILIQLENNKNVDLYIYCKPSLFSILQESGLSQYIEQKKVINWSDWQFRLSWHRTPLYYKKQLFKKKENKVAWLIYAIVVELLDKTFFAIKCKVDELNRVDAFFSVYEQLPARVLKCNNIVKVLYIHDVTMILHPELYSRVKNNPIIKIVKTMNNEQLFFANSHNTKNDFLKVRPDINSDRILIAYPGCSFESERYNIKSFEDISVRYNIKKSRYAFALCSIAPNKNILRIVRSFLEFVKRHNLDDICLVLGGALDGEYGKKLLEELSNLDGFNDYINYIGYVSDEDLCSLYRNAMFFVYTSQYEGFGTPPLEAMMCGCPVIVSNNSSLPEVVGDAGILIPWNEDEAHIEAYRRYFFNDKLRKQNGLLGKKRANAITWKKSVEFIVTEIGKEVAKLKCERKLL